MIGVTGTNGKTTTTYLLEAALRAAGVRTGLIGTVGTGWIGRPLGGVRTTRDHARGARPARAARLCASAASRPCAMEVSSHALVLGRVDASSSTWPPSPTSAATTSTSTPTMEDYFAAKASLFTPERARPAWSTSTTRAAGGWPSGSGRGELRLTTVSLREPGATGRRRTGACEPTVGPAFTAPAPDGGRRRSASRLPGDFNVANALAALAMVAAAAGSTPERRPPGLADAGGARAGWSGSTPARTRPWSSSTTPTRPTRSTPRWRAAAADRAAG